MTSIFALTEQLENNQLLISDGRPNNDVTTPGPVSTLPFYVDSQGALNFGYGIMIPVATTPVTTAFRNQIESILKDHGVPQSTLDVIGQYIAEQQPSKI